jgi:hypothetical protein
MEEEMGEAEANRHTAKDAFEHELRTVVLLAQKGIKGRQVDRDPIVKRLKADVKASKKRLAKIADIDKRTEDMIRIKAEKAAAPKKEQASKAEKAKAASQEGKAKKQKPAAEGAKVPKKAESPAEAKARKRLKKPRKSRRPSPRDRGRRLDHRRDEPYS